MIIKTQYLQQNFTSVNFNSSLTLTTLSSANYFQNLKEHLCLVINIYKDGQKKAGCKQNQKQNICL